MGHVDLQPSSFISDFLLQTGGVAVIDGGLATELERHGADLNDPLWSAKCLLSSPHLIRTVVSRSHFLCLCAFASCSFVDFVVLYVEWISVDLMDSRHIEEVLSLLGFRVFCLISDKM